MSACSANNKFQLFCDGAAVPNPGHGSFGFVLFLNGKAIDGGYGGLGLTDSVQAEFSAISEGLASFAKHLCPQSELTIYTDSQYVCGLLNSKPTILTYRINEIRRAGTSVNIEWISRKSNQISDHLAKILRPRPIA